LEKKLRGKIGKHGGRYHGKGNRNESAYTFSREKQSGNQGRSGPNRQGQQQTISGKTKKKGPQEIEVGRNSKYFVDTVGCKGTKHQIAPSRNKE
jgi:hypothetical protein